MASTQLEEAIKDLSKFFSLFTLEDLVGAAISDNPDTTRQAIETLRLSNMVGDQDPIAKFSKLIVDAQTGVNLSKDILKEYRTILEAGDVAEKVYKTLDILAPDENEGLADTNIRDILGKPDGINENPNSPTKDSPSFGVFAVNTARITPSTRNANAAALFMNSVPTIEFSKCVPFIDIQFQLFRTAVDVSGRPQTLSLTRFLEGASKMEEGSADYAMQTGIPAGRDDVPDQVFSSELQEILGGDKTPNGFSGMELFTAPQTLVNADPDNSDGVRVAPIIDKFRPFLSIVDLTVSVVATTGIMSYKTAKLELVLHDRSRLYEIADFVKPDMAGSHNSELLIEYGWSHPDTQSKTNPYGPFLNGMRKKEKYHIRNSSFAIKDNGEVAISLELYMKGVLDFYNSSITEGGDIEEAQKAVTRIQERLSDIRSRVFKQKASYMKEIRGVQILNAAQDQTSQLDLSKEMKKELKSALKQLKNTESADAKTYHDELVKLYGTDGTDGVVATLLSKLSNELQRRMKLIQRGKTRTHDPFIFDTRSFEKDGTAKKLDRVKEKKTKYVSFGKLAMIFLGIPLASSKKFDDVQFIFYPMNNGAGAARVLNVAQFPIDIDRFQQKFKKIKTLRRSNNLTLRDFVQFMGTTFFDDPSALGYGMRDLFTYEDDKELGTKVKVKDKELRENPAAMAHEQDRIMRDAGVPDGIFKMPHLDVYVETVPAESTDANSNSKAVNDTRTILRVHFYDRVATSYSSLGDLLRAVRDSDIGSIKPPPPSNDEEARNDHDEIAQKMIKAATDFGLIEDMSKNRDRSAVEIKGGPQKLKDFIKNTMPSIDLGLNNTAVISSGFKTQHDPRLSTVNMLRSGDASPLTPTGAGQGGIPLWLSPGQMDMNIIGCPIMEFAQGFFIDSQTNTSIDNIYHVTKLEHSINHSNFKTSLGFVPFDAYGQYRSLRDRIAGAIAISEKLKAEAEENTNTTANT